MTDLSLGLSKIPLARYDTHRRHNITGHDDGISQNMNTVAVGSLPGPSNSRPSSQLSDSHSGLRAVTECTGTAVVVHVGGDVDASNEAVWQRLVSRSAAIAIAPGPYVIDVRELDFMGSCAYAVLAQESVRCRRRGVSLRLVSNQPIVARTIAACGLRRLLPMYSSVETALVPPSSG
ncbi:anti-sigma factor antagonist [Mycobacterium riyadhense]